MSSLTIDHKQVFLSYFNQLFIIYGSKPKCIACGIRLIPFVELSCKPNDIFFFKDGDFYPKSLDPNLKFDYEIANKTAFVYLSCEKCYHIHYYLDNIEIYFSLKDINYDFELYFEKDSDKLKISHWKNSKENEYIINNFLLKDLKQLPLKSPQKLNKALKKLILLV